MFFFITIILGLAVLAIAGFEDLKTREIPDYVSYFLIVSAIVVRILWFMFEKDLNIVMWMPVSFGVLCAFSYLMYKGGQWGGGDVKIMAGISLLFSSFHGEFIPFFLNFLLNTLVVGAFYGAFGIGVIFLKNIKKIKLKIWEKILPAIVIGATIALFYFLPTAIAFLGLFVMISIISLVYFKKVEKIGMQMAVPVEKLTEGDWLVDDIKLNRKVFLKKRSIGLTIEDIKKLKSNKKIKIVKIKIGIPFSPVFLIAVIVTLLFGNILLRLVLS